MTRSDHLLGLFEGFKLGSLGVGKKSTGSAKEPDTQEPSFKPTSSQIRILDFKSFDMRKTRKPHPVSGNVEIYAFQWKQETPRGWDKRLKIDSQEYKI